MLRKLFATERLMLYEIALVMLARYLLKLSALGVIFWILFASVVTDPEISTE